MLIVTPTFGVITGIFGWYFGSLGVEEAERRVAEVTRESRESVLQSSAGERRALAAIGAIDEHAARYESFLGGSRATPRFVTRLKKPRAAWRIGDELGLRRRRDP